MAHILFLTQVLPYPLDAGPKIRAYHVLQHLARQHRVTLVSFTRSDDRPEYVTHLASLCHAVYTVPMQRSRRDDVRAVFRATFTGEPILILRDRVDGMLALLRELMAAESFDVIHADQVSMAQYACYARAQIAPLAARARTRMILDAHNALYRVFQQLARVERQPLKKLFYVREARTLAKYERRICSCFDHVVFVAEEDRLALQNPGGAGGPPTTIIPIGIDLEQRRAVAVHDRPRLITHLGTMFWPPNVEGVLWFARDVLPLIVERVPDARLVIIGKRPPPEVEALARPGSCIQVLGYVADPERYLQETAAFIVPLWAGAGMRVKILDAWCWGLPIVSTTRGAEGISVRQGENVLLADDASGFAAAVVRLLQEDSLRTTLRENGRREVEGQYNWQTVYTAWDAIVARLLASTADAATEPALAAPEERR